jgi:hypothetical protein
MKMTLRTIWLSILMMSCELRRKFEVIRVLSLETRLFLKAEIEI